MNEWMERDEEGGEERSGWTMSGRTWKKEHGLNQDWWSKQEQKGLEESCKSLNVSSLTEERKEEDVGLGMQAILFILRMYVCMSVILAIN